MTWLILANHDKPFLPITFPKTVYMYHVMSLSKTKHADHNYQDMHVWVTLCFRVFAFLYATNFFCDRTYKLWVFSGQDRSNSLALFSSFLSLIAKYLIHMIGHDMVAGKVYITFHQLLHYMTVKYFLWPVILFMSLRHETWPWQWALCCLQLETWPRGEAGLVTGVSLQLVSGPGTPEGSGSG